MGISCFDVTKWGLITPIFNMIIDLSHPVHGAKVATMDLEADADEKNGWTRYNPDTPSEPEAAPVNVLEVKRRRKVITEEV
jgi:hypothetical protein